jgi:uncharacterized phage protein gp47/JayE
LFESQTFEVILKRAMEGVADDIDKREGSIYYDAVSGIALIFADLYTQLDVLYEQLQLKTATGEALDLKGSERLVTRKAATRAEYEFVFDGEVPPLGSTFYTDSGIYFTLLSYDDGALYLESVETGTANNEVEMGEKAIPKESFPNLKAASFGNLYVPATDDETDTEYRQSIIDNIIPGENGNVQHYKNWCKEVDGVGQARIIPCASGPNTVTGVIIASDGTAASDELVAKVQEYIDPERKGLGEGAANIGAHFYAISAIKAYIPVRIWGLKIANGYEYTSVYNEIKQTLEEYLKNLALSNSDEIIVKSSILGCKVQDLDCVDSYGGISLSKLGAPNCYQMELEAAEVPTLGEVTLN